MTPSSDLQHRTQARQQQTQQHSTDVTQRSKDLAHTIEGARRGLAAALADRIGPERFIRAAVTSIRTTPHLAECSDDSILGALFVAAQLGLEVGGPRGLVYLVPYRNKKTGRYEAQLIIGYRGWIDLFYRAGARSVQWFLVREGDTFRIGSDAIRGKVYHWEQADPNSTANVTGVVAQVVTATGGIVWEYLSRADIDKRSTDSPFWRQWPAEMMLKTGMRALQKTAPTSADLALAQHVDETVQHRVEVPGLPVEQRTEHLPLLPSSAGQRPTAPRPRDEALPEMGPQPVDNEPEPPEDWEARERAEHTRWAEEEGAE